MTARLIQAVHDALLEMRTELRELDARIAAAEALLDALHAERRTARSAGHAPTGTPKQKRAPWSPERRATMMAIFAKRRVEKEIGALKARSQTTP